VIVFVVDRFPELSETFVVSELRALRGLGREVRVESVARPDAPADVIEEARVWEAESTSDRIRALARLALTHPVACLRDLVDRRRWRREERVPPLRMLAPAALRVSAGDHLHAHFAAEAALSAMRIARIRGVPWSVTAHGWDIWQRPANLLEKLASAAFATTGCEYNARHLGEGVEVVVMGVDGEAFSRASPHPGGRTVLAVGRLVEKKGFADLVAAAQLLPDVRVLIAGDGPLRESLAAAHVTLLGPVPHDEVRALLESADVLCAPCVVAADGDRDAMPVIVKEALAMEVPVVATDEVGLPEVVKPGWGTLVPTHDPVALAAALREELDRPVSERAARGAAGRAFVLEHADVHAEAAKLAALIDGKKVPGTFGGCGPHPRVSPEG
jgi:glycosyltransferase involved in cell wall biosynthesis